MIMMMKNKRICKVISIMLVLLLSSAMVITPTQMTIYNGYVYDADAVESIIENDELFNSLNSCEQLDVIELYIYSIDDKLQRIQSTQEQPHK